MKNGPKPRKILLIVNNMTCVFVCGAEISSTEKRDILKWAQRSHSRNAKFLSYYMRNKRHMLLLWSLRFWDSWPKTRKDHCYIGVLPAKLHDLWSHSYHCQKTKVCSRVSQVTIWTIKKDLPLFLPEPSDLVWTFPR